MEIYYRNEGRIMKKVISNDELYIKMKEAINLLCNTVKITLGPKGNNVIIDHSSFSPFITNDGVTIAENIESDDEVINTILSLAKEASIKTNENVGDGTTTTLVLLQGIFNEGLNLIKNGKNPIILKKELYESLNKIIDKLNNISKKPKNRDLLNIAITSSNDIEIGTNIYKAYIKTKNINAIKIKESNNTKTNIEFLKGYSFETILASNYFINENNKINYYNSYILIINNILNNIEQIADILNLIIKNNNNLVIIANDYNDDLVNDIVSLYLSNKIKICLLKSPEYGNKQKNILKDISIITNATIIEERKITINDLGIIKNITINNTFTTLSFKSNEKINNEIKNIIKEKDILESNIDLEFYDKRIAMLSTCIATINIGAITTTESREKKMRYDDALYAINAASKGILPGSGISLLKISEELNINNDADKIFKNILILPIKQILKNAGLNNDIINIIKENNFNLIYNIYLDSYEKINETSIIDPTLVVINSIKNATSIASMLLTTKNLIINEYKNNVNLINDFKEL